MRSPFASLAAVASLFALSCTDGAQRDFPFGSDARADLIVVVQESVESGAVQAWMAECVVLRDNPRPGQETLRNRVRSIVKVSVDGREAYAIQFHHDASPLDRETVAVCSKASSVVARVLENVAPNSVGKQVPGSAS